MKILRRIKQNWKWFIINIIGLSTALTCLLVIFRFVRHELSYDRFHSKADRICRVTTDSNRGAVSIHPARVYGDWPVKLMDEYPAIEKTVRLVPYRNAIVRIDDQKFYSQSAFMTDSSFFDVFDFKVLAGDRGKAFTRPGTAFISRSLAEKYFGHTDVIGREITILHQQDPNPKVCFIEGVTEDFPVNSHFHAEILTSSSSFSNLGDRTTWAYTYYLLKSGTDPTALRKTIQAKWEEENETDEPTRILHLQKLTDIHLFSQKTREIEKNGNIRSVILLMTGGVIIIIIALVNFINMSRVQFIAGIKSIRLKLIHGASKMTIALAIAADSLLISVPSAVIALDLASMLKDLTGIVIPDSIHIVDLVLIVGVFIIVIAFFAVFPLLNTRIITGIQTTPVDKRLYTFPLVIQFTLAMTAITGTLVLNRQMDFISASHPASQNAGLIVINDNPWEVVQNYELLKFELLKTPLITGITAAMEGPGGEILDNVEFEMEGIDKEEGNAISIFTIDTNFFSFFGIEPLAGSMSPGYTPSRQWEADAVELSNLRVNTDPDKEKIAEYERKIGEYREKYFLNQSALKLLGITNPDEVVGKRFRINFFLPDLFPEGEIMGVVPDFHYTNLHNKERPLVIVPRKMFNYNFIIGLSPEHPGRAIAAVDEAWGKINPEFPFRYQFITDIYQDVYRVEYAQTRVLSLFALISVILSALGIFALAAFTIQQRVKEIGIRKVNGAQISEVMLLLNRDFIRWIAVAFLIATPVAWIVMHKWLENFAYKTELNWWIFVMAGTLAMCVALLTVSLQTFKAAKRNPVEALRYE